MALTVPVGEAISAKSVPLDIQSWEPRTDDPKERPGLLEIHMRAIIGHDILPEPDAIDLESL